MKQNIFVHINYPNELNLPQEFCFTQEVKFDYSILLDELHKAYLGEGGEVLLYLNSNIFKAFSRMGIDIHLSKNGNEGLNKIIESLDYPQNINDYSVSFSLNADFLFKVYLDLEPELEND